MRADSVTYARRYRSIHNALSATATDRALDAVADDRLVCRLADRLNEGDADLGDEADCITVLSRARCPVWPIEDDLLQAVIDEARVRRAAR